jgi:hypothetical protein
MIVQSPSQEIPRSLCKPKFHYRDYQQPTTGQGNPVHTSFSLISILILFSYLRLGLQNWVIFHKICYSRSITGTLCWSLLNDWDVFDIDSVAGVVYVYWGNWFSFRLFFVLLLTVVRSRVNSVSIVSDYGLDNRAIGVRSPAGAKDFSSSLYVQTGSGTHPASCTMGTGGPFPGGKARPRRDADHSPPSSAEVVNE